MRIAFEADFLGFFILMALAQARLPGGTDLSALPADCVAIVVSFTSPADACRLASFSAVFKSACDDYNFVWDAFLPPDWRSMVDWRDPSLKKLYFSLCDDPVLLGDGNMSFSLDRCSGKKCIMLSARALSIIWGDTPMYWSWNEMPNSRFAEVAELVSVCWIEIRGTISARMLSPGTLYAAYLVFKSTPTSYGFESQPVEVGAGFAGDEVGNRERSVDLSRENIPRDGWSEIELGVFLTTDGEDREVEMGVLETKRGNWKRGLIVEGIEIRPKRGIVH